MKHFILISILLLFAISPMYSQYTENQQKEVYSFSCPDEKHPHIIDLGLPSGTKWACCNIGAKKPNDYGDYYSWAETVPNHLTSSEYSHNDISDNIMGTKYDVAHVKWGGKWQMPSEAQIRELVKYCDINSYNPPIGMPGKIFTSTINGKKIFLPYGGHYGDEGSGQYRHSKLFYVRNHGYYWSGDYLGSGKATILEMHPSTGITSESRYYGCSVRAVIKCELK